MADDNDDSWLYGANHEDSNLNQQKTEDELQQEENTAGKEEDPSDEIAQNFDANQQHFDEEHNFEEAGGDEQSHLDEITDANKESKFESKANDSDDDDEDDDDDDDINVVIGDIKSGGSAFTKNFQEKQKAGAGSKFSIEEFESVGAIAGQNAAEYNLDSIEDKPWRKPGADITDYFNYGFNEETWRAYCERQKRLRINDSCVGLIGLTVAQNNPMNMDQKQPGIHIGINKRLGPRPKPTGTINVIGASTQMNPSRPQAPRENIIQVMTADRREYSRTVVGGQQQNSLNFNAPNDNYYNNEDQDAYNYGYEPTQEQQWEQNPNPNWAPREIKELTVVGNNHPQGMMNIPPPSMHMGGMNPMNMQGMMPVQQQMHPSNMKPSMSDSRDRRERDMSRSYDPRKRPRSNSRDRDRKDRRDPREMRDSRDDRRKRRSRSREKDSSRRDLRSRSRDRKRSKSKDRSKDKKFDEKDRRPKK